MAFSMLKNLRSIHEWILEANMFPVLHWTSY